LTVVAFLLFGASVVAVVMLSRTRTASLGEYLGGKHNLGGFVSAFTWSASAASAGLFLGGAGMAYTFGWPGTMYQFGSLGGIFLAWILLAPRLRKLAARTGAISTPTLIARRYGMPVLKLITAVWTLVFVVPMMIVQFRGAGLMFETYFGLSYTWSLVVFGLIVAAFTALGGYFAVAYLDTLQGLVMTLGMAILLPVGLASVGGFSGLNASLAGINPKLVEWTGMMPKTLQIGLAITFLVSFLGQPHLVIRFYSLKDTKAARIAFPLSMALTTFWMLSGCMIGLISRVAFPGLRVGDLAMPTAISNFLPVAGIIVWLALISAIMSTIDSLLLAVGSAFSHDIVKGYLRPDLSERSELLLSKVGVFVICVISFLLAIKPPGLITIINSFAMGAFALLLGIPLVLGVYWKRASAAAALTAVLAGPAVFILWKNYLVKTTGLHEMPAAILITVPLVILVNLLTAPPSQQTVDRYFSS
jgi:sodium/pantothenate symporter